MGIAVRDIGIASRVAWAIWLIAALVAVCSCAALADDADTALHVSIENAAFAGICQSAGQVRLSVSVENPTDRAIAAPLEYSILQMPSGKRVGSGLITVVAGPGTTARKPIPFPRNLPYGLYEIKARIAAKAGGEEWEARVAIMPPAPLGREMDNLGFSIHVAKEDNAKLLRRIGLRWARVDWNWGDRGFAPGMVAWDFTDPMMAVADKYGLKLFPVLAYIPNWARKPDGTFDPDQHAAFVKQVLSRYRGRIPAFNVWNEPENGPVSAATRPDLWEADLKAVRKAAREADPQCKMVGLALSGNPGDPGGWFESLLGPPYSLGQYLDVYDWHNYPAPRGRKPEERSIVSSVDDIGSWIPKVQEKVAGGGVWITEHGYSTCDPDNAQVKELSKAVPQLAPWSVTERQQGDYLTRQLLIELASGMDKVFLYQLGPDYTSGGTEDQFGVTRIRKNGISPKLAYVQLGALIREIADAKAAGVTKPTEQIRTAWFQRGSLKIAAIWVIGGTSSATFQVTNGYTCDPYGNRKPANGEITITLTESPVYVVGTAVSLVRWRKAPPTPV